MGVRNEHEQHDVAEEEATNEHMVEYIEELLEDDNKFPREVGVYFYLWRVHDIDTANQSFEITISLSLNWIEDNAKENFRVKDRLGDIKKRWDIADFGWNPQYRILNITSDDNSMREQWFRVRRASSNDRGIITKQEWYDTYMQSNEPMEVTQAVRAKITLSEPFQLHHFPFDLQPLHFQISSSWDCENVLLTFNSRKPCAMDPSALDSQEWVLHSPRLISYQMDVRENDLPLLSQSSQSATGARYSRAYISLTAKRKPQFYMWNIFIMLLILGSLSFTVFSIDALEAGDRLSNMLTLILALVAFKLVLAEELPSISYLTILDAYTLASVTLMFFISVVSALIPTLSDMGFVVETMDLILIWTSAVVWILVNVWFFVKVITQSRARAADIEDIESKFEAYRHRILGKKMKYGYKSLVVRN